MPIQCSIEQPSGAIATYHVIKNATVNADMPPNGSVVIDSYLNEDRADTVPLGSMQIDISPLVQGEIPPASSIFVAIEAYLLTTATFSHGIQVA